MLTVQGGLDRSAYCPGEYLLISASCNNDTTKEMGSMNVNLVQVVKYHARRAFNREKIQTIKKTICRIPGEPIPPKQDCTLANLALQIPGACPTINNAIIEVSYRVEIHVVVPRGFDLRLKLPILIGTVPFRPVQDHRPILPILRAPDMAPQPNVGIAPPAPNIFGHPGITIPSYAPAIGDHDVPIDVGADKVEVRYIPLYTYAAPYQETYNGASPSPSYNQGLGATAPPIIGVGAVHSVQNSGYDH